jgi:hypothetical protein
MMSCKRATEQISVGLDRPLTFSERLTLKVHLMMCDKCARCQKQLQQLHRVCQKRTDQMP